MEPDGSRQQIPQELSSSHLPELQPISSQRKEDQQQKEHHSFWKKAFSDIFNCLKPTEPQLPDLNNTRFWNRKYGTITFKVFSFVLELSGLTNLKNLIICDKNVNIDQPAKNSSNFHSTSNTGTINEQEILKFKQRFEKKTKGSKNFENIMSLISNREKQPGVDAGSLLHGLLNYYSDKHEGTDKQYAFSIVALKDGGFVISDAFYPKKKDKFTSDIKHSEEILIDKLDNFFHEKGKIVEIAYIYTYNSPCLKREKEHILPCRYKLELKSCKWQHEYGFNTVVLSSKFYGFSGPNYFKDPNISCVLDKYLNICKDIPFELDNDFDNLKVRDFWTSVDVECKKDIKQHWDTVDIFVKEFKSEFKSSPCLTKQEHLDRIMKFIQDNFPENLRYRTEILNKKLDCRLKDVGKERLMSCFSAAVADIFEEMLKSSFEGNGPLQLYHLKSKSENILN